MQVWEAVGVRYGESNLSFERQEEEGDCEDNKEGEENPKGNDEDKLLLFLWRVVFESLLINTEREEEEKKCCRRVNVFIPLPLYGMLDMCQIDRMGWHGPCITTIQKEHTSI